MPELSPTNVISVDNDRCTGCGICVEICPLSVISFENGEIKMTDESFSGMLKIVFNTDKEFYCLGCGHCVAICPHDALSHRQSPLDISPLIQKELLPEAHQVEHLLKSRRSIRAYSDRSVERDKLLKLFQVAAYAPSGGNTQGTEWIVVDDRKTLDRIRSLVIEWMNGLVSQNHEMLRIAPIENTLEVVSRGKDPILRNAPVLIVAKAEPDIPFREQDIDISLANFEIAAYAEGLGTTWLAMVARVIQAYPPLRELLGIRADEYYYAMLVGYPKYRFRRIPYRQVRDVSFVSV